MRNASGEPPDRFDLLRVHQLSLQPLALGHVGHRGDDVDGLTLRVEQRVHRDIERQRRAVGPLARELAPKRRAPADDLDDGRCPERLEQDPQRLAQQLGLRSSSPKDGRTRGWRRRSPPKRRPRPPR